MKKTTQSDPAPGPVPAGSGERKKKRKKQTGPLCPSCDVATVLAADGTTRRCRSCGGTLNENGDILPGSTIDERVGALEGIVRDATGDAPTVGIEAVRARIREDLTKLREHLGPMFGAMLGGGDGVQ